MDDQAAPDHARRTRRYADDVEVGRHAGIAGAVGLEARQVAGVALGRARVRVRLAVGIEVALGAHAVARAAVAGLVYVEAELAVGPEACNPGAHAHLVADLDEADATAHPAAR